MNKKILAKTLLPIAAVALLGGGITSSLVACSKQKVELVDYELFNSRQDIYDYINKNASHPSAPDLTYDVLNDYNDAAGSSSLEVGTRVQNIMFPTIAPAYDSILTISFGTASDSISLCFYNDPGKTIELVDGDDYYLISFGSTYSTFNFSNDKFTIYRGEHSSNAVISLADDYTTVYSIEGISAADGMSYRFNGWNDVDEYSESAWNYYLNNLNDTNLICTVLYWWGILETDEWDYIKFEELKDSDSLTWYNFYLFYENKILYSYMFYKDINGSYFQSDGFDYKVFTTEPYSASYHEIRLDEENNLYVLKNCGNFVADLVPYSDDSLGNVAYFLRTNFDGSNSLFVF